MDSERFLDRFRQADRGGAPLAALIDDHDGLASALEHMPEAVGCVFAAAVGTQHGPPVVVNEDCFASAACDRHGTLLIHGPRFADWFVGIDPLSAAVRNIGPGTPRLSLFADDRTGRPVALAAGTQAVARLWPLDPHVRAALESGVASHAVIAFRPGAVSWEQSANAFRLTAAESGLVAALGRHGDLQRAAEERGVAYETARKFVASAMRKTGAKRQTELVSQTLTTAAGDIAEAVELVRLTRDLFELTEQQAQLAVLVSRGATREDAADALRLSHHRAKADLKTVFQACGVASAVDLARIVAEINALEGLATACEVTIAPRGRRPEPLRLVSRSWAAGRIAVADHGPANGTPAVILHSGVSGRHHPERFIAALHAAGYRPIAYDRAGYGLTDAVEGNLIDAGAKDFEDVLDALDLGEVLVVARCNTASVIACAAEASGRIAGGVLLWPEAPRRPDRPERRMTDRFRAIFTRYPQLADAFSRLAARRISAGMIERLWRKASAGIDTEQALLNDPQERADIVRGGQQAALGMKGFMGEALELGLGPRPRRIADGRSWTLIFGEVYERCDATESAAYWSDHVAGAHVEIVEGGLHFLHSTHTANVVAALDRARAGKI